MSTHKNLMTVCCAAVLALGLAACGSSSDDNGMADNGGMEPDACPAGQVGTPPNCMAPPPANLTTNFADAQDATDDALAAGELASGALESAMESDDKLTTMEVAGDSTVAMKAAEAILQAQTDAGQAVMDAQTALDDANAAKTVADDIADDHPQKASLVEAIDDAIEEAEKALEDATAISDGDAIADAVAEVTGDEDADPQGTPRDIANSVGMDIAMALLPTAENDGSGVRHTNSALAPAGTIAEELKVEMDDRVGHTWAEIVDTTKMRIATSATDTDVVDAASIAGMSIVSAATATIAGLTEGDGTQVAATYKGIVGTAFCVGSDCVVEVDTEVAANRKFTGGWYFTPADSLAHWVKNAADTGYVADILFASFGHWLTVDATSGNWTVHTFAASSVATAYSLDAADATNEFGDDDKATYSGTAVGMSVYKADNAAGDGQDIDSGRFTADVTLNATFGAGPMIGGHIDNFQGDNFQGNAVGDWRVTLEDTTLAASGMATTTGATVATGRDGVWTNEAYGPLAARPVGVYGDFNAHFSDGHAAGAYATRKD